MADARFSKRLAGECLHCTEPMIDGSDYCTAHDARERGNRATRQRRLRQKRAKAGVCSAGCGRKVGRRLRPDRTAIPRECSDCTKLHRKRTAEARARVRNERAACVTSTGEISPPVKLEFGKDGATRTRYVPRPGAGGQSREEIDRGLLRDLRDSFGRLQGVASRWPPPRDAIAALPRIQRTEAWNLVAEPIVQGIRLAFGVIAALPTSWGSTCPCCGHEASGPDSE